MPTRVVSVVGTRPNLMKIAPIASALDCRGGEFEHVLVHTGQHYDYEMSQIFIDELGMPPPDYSLGVGSGSHAAQIAHVIERLEPVLAAVAPDIVLVPGDVNSTLGAALTASILGIPVGHVEAGLRSFDRSMPEELNRVLVDQLSDALFVHSPEATRNLLDEGRPAQAIHDVGNTMIDTLVALGPAIESRHMPTEVGIEPGSYVVVTLHRPTLVDTALLEEAVAELDRLAVRMPVVFPVHPRTRAALDRGGLAPSAVRLLPPVGYLEFLSLVAGAAVVLTDSGGVQEETTYLGIPCLTLRDTTERPITITLGTNVLLGLEPARIADVPDLIEQVRERQLRIPPGWDGHAAERIVGLLSRKAVRTT